MITIRCYGEDSLGGRTQDDFLIYDFDSIEDFKNSINKNEFIKCKEIKQKHKVYIVVEEELVDRIVNFSNYMKICTIDVDLMNKEEFDEIINNLCKHCVRHDGGISQMWDCGYYPTRQQNCKNYKETFKAKYKRKFKNINVNEINKN